MEIANKVVIITGGLGGMGFETAKTLLHHGAKVQSCVVMTDVILLRNN